MVTTAKAINITKLCGKKMVSRSDGKKVHDLIIAEWENSATIQLDFGNVLIASVSFLDEIFGRLAMEYDKEQLTSKLKVKNIQEFDRVLLNNIVRSRWREKELKGEPTPSQ